MARKKPSKKPLQKNSAPKKHSGTNLASSSILIDLNSPSKREYHKMDPSSFQSIKERSSQDHHSFFDAFRTHLPIILFSLLLLIIDQATKNLVLKKMYPAQSIPLIEGVFHLTYAQNTGAAFSLFTDANTLLSILSFFIIGGVIYWILQTPKEERGTLLALGVLLSGALGNLTDRLLLGYVVDFIDIRVWPIFNVADIAISLSLLLLVVQLWKK